jgi:tetratricopeptide (TPR) repeat protein
LETTALGRKIRSAPSPASDEIMRRMLALDNNNASMHEAAARYLSESGRRAEAVSAIERAIALRPSHPRFHELQGDLLRDAKDYDGAVRAYREESARLVAATPPWRVAKHKLLVTLSESDRRSEVIDEARAVIAAAPDDDLAYALMGLAHRAAGEFPPAKAAFDQALKINPNNEVAKQALSTAVARN